MVPWQRRVERFHSSFLMFCVMPICNGGKMTGSSDLGLPKRGNRHVHERLHPIAHRLAFTTDRLEHMQALVVGDVLVQRTSKSMWLWMEILGASQGWSWPLFAPCDIPLRGITNYSNTATPRGQTTTTSSSFSASRK